MAQENVVEQLLSMDDLIKRVPYYKKRPIYFGVASWKESAIKSLEARGIGEGHHVDQAMQEQGIGTNFYQCYNVIIIIFTGSTCKSILHTSTEQWICL